MKYLLFAAALSVGILACKADPPPEDRPDRSERLERDDEAPEYSAMDQAAQENTAADETPPEGQRLPKGNAPFVGRRVFETRPAVSGTGTPHRYVDITAEGNVFFGYGQQNPQAGTMGGERYAAGKYRRVMKCVFEKLGDTRYYVIGKTTIVELDAAGKALRSPDCCGNEQIDLETECQCQGRLFDPGTAPDPGM